MNAPLICGLGAAGLLLGPFLDTAGARVARPAPAPAPAPAEDALETDTSAADDAVVEALPAPAPPSKIEKVAASLLTGALFAGAAWRLGDVPGLAAACVLFAGLIVVSVSDVRVGLIPRRFVYPTGIGVIAALVGVSLADGHWSPLENAGIGGAIGFGFFFAVWFIAPRKMGFGDVRLAGVIGVALGWYGLEVLYIGFVVGFVAGSIIGIAKMLRAGTGRKTSLPFAPGLAIGAAVGILWGPWLVHLWLHSGS